MLLWPHTHDKALLIKHNALFAFHVLCFIAKLYIFTYIYNLMKLLSNFCQYNEVKLFSYLRLCVLRIFIINLVLTFFDKC